MQMTAKPSEHPVERTSMSILNDLDPANSRIPTSTRRTSSRIVAWASALLLLVTGMLWIYFGSVFDGKGERTISPVASDSNVPMPPLLPPQPATATAPATEESGAALIRTATAATDESVDKIKQPNAFAALQDELPNGSPPSPKAAATSQAGKTKATQRTEQKTHAAAKSTKHLANKKSTNGQRQARSDKKPAERDIDIISAIVR